MITPPFSRRIFFLALLFIVSFQINSQSSSETVSIPDSNFEQALIDLGIDSDQTLNNSVSVSDVELIETLDVSGLGITSLTGIEAFANLKFLYAYNNELTGIDVSNNPLLVHLSLNNNSLTQLYVTDNLFLKEIHVNNNRLIELNLGNHPELVILHAGGNQINTIDLSGSPDLASLILWGSNIGNIDLGNNTELTELVIDDNNLSSLDVSFNSKLKFLYASNNQLINLNIANGNNLNFTPPDWNNYSLVVQGNQGLSCIQVDPEMMGAIPSDWVKDYATVYSSDCVTKPEYVNIPDPNFEQALIDLGIDSDATLNSLLLLSDAESVTNLNLRLPVNFPNGGGNMMITNVNSSITDLTGIEAFVNLKELLVDSNNLEELDLHSLNDLNLLYASNNNLTQLDLSQNPGLRYLRLNKNPLTQINLSNNTNLEFLNINYNNITQLDLSQNSLLRDLQFLGNPVSSIDTQNLSLLETLYCGKTNITSLDLSNNLKLKNLNIDDLSIAQLDLSKYPELEKLWARNTSLNTVDFSNNPNLLQVWIEYSPLRSIDLSNNPALFALVLQNNSSLAHLDLRNGNNSAITFLLLNNTPNLTCINADENISQAMIASGKTFSTDCGDFVQIPDANFEQALIDLDIDSDGVINQKILRSDAEAVTELNISDPLNNPNLPSVDAKIENLTGIEAFTSLMVLDCRKNEIQELKLFNNTQLIELHSTENLLTELDIRNNPSLSILYIEDNQIQELNLTNNSALTVLECGRNQLTQLDVSNNSSLRTLGFGLNNIREIDVSNNFELKVFWCNGNPITHLDLDANTNLIGYGLSSTPLEYVTLKNGNNSNVTYFEANNTPSLGCINSDAVVSEAMTRWNDKTFSEDCSTSVAGKWIIAPETGSLKVGPAPGSGQYWTFNANGTDIDDRRCYLDDVYEFREDGSFRNVQSEETILEPFQGVETQVCGVPVAPHDGTNPATYTYDQINGTITLNGKGSFLGLAKVVNGRELEDPNDAPDSITYHVFFSDNGDRMIVSIESNPGLFWTYTMIKDAVFIPDTNFEQALIDLEIDSDGIINQKILRSDAESVTELNLTNPKFASDQRYANSNIVNVEGKIQDLTGIEAFKNITRLSAWDNALSSIDVSNNILLERLELINNQITSIDVSKNVKLKVLWLEMNQLQQIDVIKNTELVNLALGYNQLTDIDVTQNSKLWALTIEGNNLTTIDVSQNTVIAQIWLAENPNLTHVDFSKNTAMYGLGIYDTSIKTLDLSNNPMTRLYLANNPNLEHVDLRNGNNSNLNEFWVDNTPKLTCINGDAEISQAMIDSGKSFSEDCGDFIYIPDANFEQALIDLGIDSDDVVNTSILRSDAEAVDYYLDFQNPKFASYGTGNTQLINVEGKIEDITGIEAFVNVLGLNLSDNNLSSLDLSNNTKITNLYVNDNRLTAINISNCSDLRFLHLGNNEINNIDVSNNPLLEELAVINNNLTEINISGNPLIKWLHCADNDLSSLNMANGNNDNFEGPNWSAYAFWATGNPGLSCIQVDNSIVNNVPSDWIKDPLAIYSSDCVTKPEYVNIPDLNFEQSLIDLGIDSDGVTNTWLLKSDAEAVTELNLNNPKFDPSIFANPEIINVSGKIAELTGIEAFVNLVSLVAAFGELSEVDLSNNTSLEELFLNDNQLSGVDVSMLSNLKRFGIMRNPITSEIDVSGNPALEELFVHYTGISSIDLSGNPNLWNLFIQNNQLTSLDLSANTALKRVSAQHNFIPQLDITSLSSIERIDAQYNTNMILLTGVNGNSTLKFLNLSGTGLSNFNGAPYPNLEWLSLNDNDLGNFNGNNNLSLQNLFLSNNAVKKLNLTGNTQLTRLEVMNNAMEELDLRNGNNAALGTLRASGNLLTCISVDDPTDATMPYENWELDLGVQVSINCKQAEEVVIIPDPAFEQALIDSGYDTNGGDEITGNILLSEAEAVTILNVVGSNITDAKGIEAFVNLIELDISNNALAEINLQENTDLVSLDISGNGLSELFISNGKIMTSLNAANNNLSTLNFADLTNLQSLDISGNHFQSLNFSEFGVITSLDVSNNQLESLDLRNGNNAELSNMNAAGNLLNCIGVDDATSIPTGWSKDAATEYTATGDCQAPVVVTRNLTVFLDRNGMVEITPSDIDNGSYDAVTEQKNLVFELSDSQFDCEDLGENKEVQLSVTDLSGNTGEAAAFVTVKDEIAPDVNAVRSITLDLNGAATVELDPLSLDNGSSDNCTGLDFAIDQSSFSFPGTYTVEFTVSDLSGNSSTANVDVEVLDSASEPTSLKFKKNLVATVYPNPFTDKIRIGFSKAIDLNSVEVNLHTMSPSLTGVEFEIEGDEIVSINAEILPAGTYSIIISVSGETKSALVIKEN
ncbi:hypothetical protein [Christiangramia sabulilitoris]|uniref:T9SS type A sorting domain-containing protein n=1 Tax=Christiangramia sabulilitoris TaxID=2583991 RepID=A0A550I437_9FLAO|nr:hypothetical protein [Christiangramia sabulilitoris]TRO65740.1 hypothetical protein FGM01_10120 [Christiangramia sabulilitoris]